MRARKVALVVAVVVGGSVAALLLWQRGGDEGAQPGAASATAPVAAPLATPAVLPHGTRRPLWIAQPGAPARRVAGIVLFDGAPAAGATVTLNSEENMFGVPEAQARSGPDGRFRFAPQLAARYLVTAARPGHAIGVAHLDLRDPTEKPEELRLVLGSCEHRVSGTVRDASGGVIEGATVRPEMWLWRGPAVVTGEDGAFEMCGPRAHLGLEFAADGYGSLAVVLDFDALLRYDAHLVPEAVISGRVESADGTPIPHAAVVAHPSSWSSMERPGSAATLAGADGRFELHGAAPGELGIAARAEGWVQTEETVVQTSAAMPTGEVVVRMTRGATVRGRVLLEGDEPRGGVRLGWTRAGETTAWPRP